MTTIVESNEGNWVVKEEDINEFNIETRDIDWFCELPEEKYMNILRDHRDNPENNDKEELLLAARKVYSHRGERGCLLHDIKDLIPESDYTRIRSCLFDNEYSSLAHLGFEVIRQLPK